MNTTAQSNSDVIPVLLQAQLNTEGGIDIHTRASADLASRPDTPTSMGDLPPELLAEILVQAVWADYYLVNAQYYSNRLPWIRLAHICRHFRAVALNTPRFWSFLWLMKSQTFAKLVALSKNAPLHINAHIDHPSSADRVLALDMILRHSYRLNELRIAGPVKVVQDFCAKAISRFHILERLELTTPYGHTSYGYDGGALAVHHITTSGSDAPSRLRHLELRRLPIRWSDLAFKFSPSNLTTLVLVGRDPRETYRSYFPDVGSFDELSSTLETVAPRMEVLEIEHAIPKLGLAVTSPAELPRPGPSRLIPFPSLKKLRLVGQGLQVAHLLDCLSLPSTATLHLTVRSHLGSKELVKSVAAHFSDKPPLLSLLVTADQSFALVLSGWTRPGASGDRDAHLRVVLGSRISAQLLLVPAMQASGHLFARVQELTLSGTFTSLKWTHVFSRLISVNTLIVDGHPWGDFFATLTTAHHRVANGRTYVPFPRLRILALSGFRFSLPKEELEPFEDLLDWAIFRCNYGVPVDEIRLNMCRHAHAELIETLAEVVVDVQWDDCETEVTTEEEDEENFGFYDDEEYGHDLFYGHVGR